jgi:hypothetical protein
MRFELPPDLTPEEERIVLAALEHALGSRRAGPSRWVLAGRVENLRAGAFQARRYTDRSWSLRVGPWARRSTGSLRGRGDAK